MVVSTRKRTAGKTPAMTFALDYLREFPGAGFARLVKAAQSHGLAAPPAIVYGNALRVIRKENIEKEPEAPPPSAVEDAKPIRRRNRRGRQDLRDLGSLVEQLQEIVTERDRLRDAVDEIGAVVKSLRGA
jgi:hypothetical protein